MLTWMLMIACIVAWGLAVFLMKIAGERLGAFTSAVFAVPGYALIALFIAPRANYSLTRWHAVAVAIGALYMVGNLAYYKLSESVDVSRLAPLTALYVAVPVVLGWVLLKEPLTARRLLGIALALVAIYLLSLPAKAPPLSALR